jgi:asparagine synthase (glutamine-hydrolysing)
VKFVCGIVGFIDSTATLSQESLAALMESMTVPIYQRGPDDLGVWTDPRLGVALGFRRLSILDLSPQGHQPMASGDGRFMVVFNGEIYNFNEIREDLAARGHAFRGHSDTEVMLAAFMEWEPQVAVRRLHGMFAIALWDRQEEKLTLFRDRVGKKPLYYGWQGSTFLFGSQLGALKVHPAFQAPINRDALALYLRHNYVPGPQSIYVDIHKLIPGCSLTVDPRAPGILGEPEAFWSPRQVMLEGLENPLADEDDAVDELHRLLLDATGKRMVADVPVGAFLSGGIDSSLIVALMQAQSSRPVRTFTIGFAEAGFDEAPFAKAVAAHLGTMHTEVYLQGKDALAVVPELPRIFDEPFSDSSMIPTWLVSHVARQQVTVALSGDGGDELFGGYGRYQVGLRAWKRMGFLPWPARKGLARCLRALSPAAWNRVLGKVSLQIPGGRRRQVTGDLLHRIAGMIEFKDFPGLYRNLVSHWEGTEMVIGSRETPSPFTAASALPPGASHLAAMQFIDFIHYLVDDILVKVDRASMASSLEARSPLLDTRVVEHAWRFRDSWKLRGEAGKWPLRRILAKYIPSQLVERPKQGFGIPLGEWLRGPLKPWAEELLAPDRLRREGYFRPEPIRQRWKEHQDQVREWDYHLWDILMFNAWLDFR